MCFWASPLAPGDLHGALGGAAEEEVVVGGVVEVVALVGGELAATGDPSLLALDVALVDLQALGGGERLQDQLQLDPHRRRLAPLAAHLLDRLAGVLEVLVEAQPGTGEAKLHLPELAVDLPVDHGLGDVDAGGGAEALQDGGLEALGVGGLGGPRESPSGGVAGVL